MISKKKKLIILVAIIVLFIAMSLFMVLRSDGRRFTRNMELGNKYLLELNYEQAVIAYLAAIEITPSNPDAYIGAAYAYAGMGDYESAFSIIKEGMRLIDSDALKMRLSELEYEYLVNVGGVINGIPFVYMPEEDWIVDLIEWYQTLDDETYDDSFEQRIRKGKAYEYSRANPKRIEYFGEIENNLPNGLGIAIYGNDCKNSTIVYIGNWVNGSRDGHGLAVYSLDDEWNICGYYIGEWAADCEEGQATTFCLNNNSNSSDVKAYYGTAKNGTADGTYTVRWLFPSGNIHGYQYNLAEGKYIAFDDIYEYEGVTEPVYNYVINEDGSLDAAWHTWGGLRCDVCKEDNSEGLDIMNRRDHSFSGEIYLKECEFYYAD